MDIHRDQGIVTRFNRTLAERLFGHQYAQEMRLPYGERSSEWVTRLPAIVVALNREVTRLTGKWPSETIKARCDTKALLHCSRSSCWPSRAKAPFRRWRSLSVPGELEGGRRRATDPVWSLTVHRLGRSVTKPGYPQRGFVREELLLVPPDTQLPPDGV